MHQATWLRYTARNSSEGEILRSVCDAAGLQQLVWEPTRGEYILDLLLTDIDGVKCKVLPKVADHNALLVKWPLPAPKSIVIERTVWNYKEVDWDGLKSTLANEDWAWLYQVDVGASANQLTNFILVVANQYILQRTLTERKSTHPWMDDRVINLVRQKRDAESTEREEEC